MKLDLNNALDDYGSFVYFIKEDREGGSVKIGVTAGLRTRLIALQSGNPNELKIIGAIPCRTRLAGFEGEAIVKKIFGSKKKRSEWFRIDITESDINQLTEQLTEAYPGIFGPDIEYEHEVLP